MIHENFCLLMTWNDVIYEQPQKFILKFFCTLRSVSPVSSTCSSPPISPGCEDQNMPEDFNLNESFKRPVPPEMRHPGFPPQFYNMYQPQLLLPNNSAFHRPDGSGKSISVSHKVDSPFFQILNFSSIQIPGFVPHLSNLELIRQAGIFYPRITDLTGKRRRCCHHHKQFKYWFLIISIYVSNQHPITISLSIALDYEFICIFNFHTWLKRKFICIFPSFSQSNRRGWADRQLPASESNWSSIRKILQF